MADEVRIGFIGTGGIAGSHLKKLAETPEAKPVAFCDVDIVRAQNAAKEHGTDDAFADYRKMIDGCMLDAVYICVPPHVHGSIELDCAERGIAMFVEKPVNLYLDEAKRVAEIVEAKKIITAVGYSLRYTPPARQAKAFFEGVRPSLIMSWRWGGMPGVPWWNEYKTSGGRLVEMYTHQIDMLRWWLGEVESVYARYDWETGDAEATVPGTQSFMLNFESGATALMSCSCRVRGWRSAFDFILPKGLAQYGGEGLVIEPEDAYELPAADEDAPNSDRCFVDAVLAGKPDGILTPYADGVKSLAVTLACNESAQSGRVVKLADAVGHPRPE